MSRGNVFKLSSNNVLGGGGDYHASDIDDIKNSLKLLKAKKNQRQSSDNQSYGYNGLSNQGSSSKNYNQPKNDYNYDSLSKNHLPSSQKDFGGYSNKNYNDYPSYGNKYGSRDIPSKNTYQEPSYDYSNKPSSYSNNSRNSRNAKIPEQPSYNKYQNDYSNTKSASSNIPRASKKPQRQPVYQASQHNQFYNDREQKSIKEVNRQNQADIVEYDPSELKMCRMGCGRKFNPDSITKHEKNCKKVFQKKRKQFDSQKHRLVDRQQNKLMKQGQRVQKKIETIKKAEKIPKWKAQSLAFRAQMKQNRGGQVSASDQAAMKQAEDGNRIQCKFCGRKFNETAATRHIKFCQQQTRKNAMKKKK